jgi:hypothetical protein
VPDRFAQSAKRDGLRPKSDAASAECVLTVILLEGGKKFSGSRGCIVGRSEDALAATIKARRVCEQADPQLKEELGLDHLEGRSWRGFHRHALMTMIASEDNFVAYEATLISKHDRG